MPRSSSVERLLEALRPTPADALLVIDVQNDFCAGGSLAVPDGDAVVEPINALMHGIGTVVLTQDWHPAGHSSFASVHPGAAPFQTVSMAYGEQTLWPDHCVQGSDGAAFHPALARHAAQLIIRKGFRADIDSYSAFFENDRHTATGLTGYLRERAIERVICVGLALDYCVRFSAEDARRSGFEAVVLESACRGIDTEGSVAAAHASLESMGVARLS